MLTDLYYTYISFLSQMFPLNKDLTLAYTPVVINQTMLQWCHSISHGTDLV